MNMRNVLALGVSLTALLCGSVSAQQLNGAPTGTTSMPDVTGGSLTLPFTQDSAARMIVVGPETSGSAVVGLGLRVMGADSSGNAHDILLGTNGAVLTGNQGSSSDGAGNTVIGPFNATNGVATGSGVVPFMWNGTSFDRFRTANAGEATAGIGILGSGGMVWDPTNSLWHRLVGSSLGVLDSPRAGTADKTITKTSLALNTSTSICPVDTKIVSEEIFFTTAGVGISLTGGTLTQATVGTTAGTTPDLAFGTANTLYTVPVPDSNAITAYGAAGTVVCIQKNRQ